MLHVLVFSYSSDPCYEYVCILIYMYLLFIMHINVVFIVQPVNFEPVSGEDRRDAKRT